MTHIGQEPSEILDAYRTFRPTGCDAPGLGLPDRQSWYVAPVSRTRDTTGGSYGASNWAVFTALLERECGPEGDEDVDPCEHNGWEVHRFGHWGPGWFEIVLVRPGSRAAQLAEECACSLADYPILDEEDHSQRESEACEDYWEEMGLSERLDLVARCNARHAGPQWRDHGYPISAFVVRRECVYDLPDDMRHTITSWVRRIGICRLSGASVGRLPTPRLPGGHVAGGTGTRTHGDRRRVGAGARCHGYTVGGRLRVSGGVG